MGKRVTLRDVAEAASCTTATVSYVLNNTPGQKITQQTRDRVLEAVRTLNYTPNSAARSLRRQRAGCIGVVIKKNLAVPRFSQTLQGIQHRLEADGYLILLLANKKMGSGYSDYLNAYYEGRVDGIVFMGKDNEGPDAESEETIERNHIPFVAFDCQRASDAYSTVDYDYRGGAQALARRVFVERPGKLLYVRPELDTAQERLREEGIRAACTEAGVPIHVCTVPITQDNLEVWDQRYSFGSTEEGARLNDRFLAALGKGVAALHDGDAVISSWASWNDALYLVCPEKRLVTGELAYNGDNQFGSMFSVRLPNFDAGVACAEEILGILAGKRVETRELLSAGIVERSPHRG